MFEVGDKVITNEAVNARGWWFKSGEPGVVIQNNRQNGYRYIVKLDNHPHKQPAYVDEDMIDLAEPVFIPPKLVPFVFINEVLDIKVGKGEYTSLEAANKRCLELNKNFNTDKIFSYVRVE